MASAVRILQIYYDAATRSILDPAFEPLDNRSNERPDWFEYWPIRRFLDSQPLDDSTYYGFFSPKFTRKTGLAGHQVQEFIARSEAGADVVTFSPFPEAAAIHLNIFLHGEACHSGLLRASQAFVSSLGIGVEVEHMVMDTRNTVFCNYFVARAPFWRAWRQVLDSCMAHAENPSSPLHAALVAPTTHEGRVGPQMKIFVMERMVSFLLMGPGRWSVANYPPFQLPVAPFWASILAQVVALDALKRSYRNGGDADFIRAFQALRKLMFSPPSRPLAPGTQSFLSAPGNPAAVPRPA